LAGKQETFTITVAYNTLDLFGKVEGTAKVEIAAP